MILDVQEWVLNAHLAKMYVSYRRSIVLATQFTELRNKFQILGGKVMMMMTIMVMMIRLVVIMMMMMTSS